MDLSREDENIDFYHLSNAYKTIDEWFSSREKSVLTKFNQYLDDNVNVIWYEVDNSVKSIPLFTRLNIGKIPLTSAELVKAMFLSRDVNEFMSREKQEQISLQWDDIEKKLHNERLWYFLTNNSNKLYQTRIDLILNLYANIPIWGQKDMEAYIKAINSVLKEYLDKNIIDFELEVDNKKGKCI